LKLTTLVLKSALVALRYCDGMKGDTVTLLYNLLLQLDIYYSKPIKGLDETIHKKIHNVFMIRWSVFHVPIHSAGFCNGQTILSEGDGSPGQEGYLVSDGGFL